MTTVRKMCAQLLQTGANVLTVGYDQITGGWFS
jgi:hypothetical protein